MSDKPKDLTEQLAQARPLTRHLVESVLMDQWPNDAAVIAFGIDSQRHFEALYYPIRNREISPEVLDSALGDGARLTAIARAAPSNPYRESDLEFNTHLDHTLDMAALREEVRADAAAGDKERGKEAFRKVMEEKMGPAVNDNKNDHDIER